MSKVETFEDFWRIVDIYEDYLRTYGHRSCPDWKSISHKGLADAYQTVKPFLKKISKSRIFHELPLGANPIAADNYHHAVITVLNPPERWFRQLQFLSSPEYLALKDGVKEEQIAVLENRKPKMPPKRPRSKRNRPEPGELYSQDESALLAELMRHHGCNSDCPIFEAIGNHGEIAEKLGGQEHSWQRSRVSRTLGNLMSHVREYPHLEGDEKYRRLCDNHEIVDVLVGLEYRPLADKLKVVPLEKVEQYLKVQDDAYS